MGKQLQIRIYPDGHIEGETLNIKGKQCEKYLDVIAHLTEARIVDSEYTREFYEAETKECSDLSIRQEV